MLKFEEIKNYVVSNKAFGATTETLENGVEEYTVKLSAGIRYLMNREDIKMDLIKAIERFYKSDFGTFFDDDEYNKPSYYADRNGYGEYAINGFDELFYIHYEPTATTDIVIYFMFER